MMAMSIAVEKIEKHDQILVWLDNAPAVVVVTNIAEGKTVRTFQVSREGAPFELNVPRGQTVDLAC
jgi:TusA-related sulfurtransferase